jgi:hypothetical protein
MTDYVPDGHSTAGVTGSLRTGTASADTVAAGSLLILNNTGAGSHNVDIAINYTWDGLSPGSAATPGKRRIVIAAGSWTMVDINPAAGDANGRCALTIDGTAAEVKYLSVGA